MCRRHPKEAVGKAWSREMRRTGNENTPGSGRINPPLPEGVVSVLGCKSEEMVVVIDRDARGGKIPVGGVL